MSLNSLSTVRQLYKLLHLCMNYKLLHLCMNSLTCQMQKSQPSLMLSGMNLKLTTQILPGQADQTASPVVSHLLAQSTVSKQYS